MIDQRIAINGSAKAALVQHFESAVAITLHPALSVLQTALKVFILLQHLLSAAATALNYFVCRFRWLITNQR